MEESTMDCALSSLSDMSNGAMVQRQIVDGAYAAVKPIQHPKDSSVIEFKIYCDSDWIELNKTELEVKFRIVKADGTNLAAGDKVGLINYPGATLFSNVKVELNDTEITYSSSNYAERAITEVLLSYGKNAADSWLQGGLFYKDTAGQMDNADPAPETANAPVNEGLKQRADFTKESKLVVTRSKLHVDLFNQAKALMNNIKMVLKFTRNSDTYCLMTNEATPSYKVVIEDMTLWIRRVGVTSQVAASVIKNPVPYNITRVVQKNFTITSGGKTYIQNNLHDGQLPTKLVLVLKRNDAHVGDYARNPFNFQNYDVSSLALCIDGLVMDGRALRFDFDGDQYMDGFWALNRALDHRYRDEGTLIERKDFKSGYAFFVYDLTASQCNDQYNDPTKKGAINAEFTFAKTIPEAITLSAYFQFDKKIIIDQAKGSVVPLY